MKFKALLASAAVIGSLAITTTACGIDGGYGGPAYVVGKYTCPDPTTGLPAYCVEYSDGTSNVVPYWVYSGVYYGSILSYSHSRYSFTRPSKLVYAPRVTNVHYHVHSYTSRTGSYSTRLGSRSRTAYQSYKSSSSYRSYSSFRSSSFRSGR